MESQYRDIRIEFGNHHDDKLTTIINEDGVTIQGYEDRFWELS